MLATAVACIDLQSYRKPCHPRHAVGSLIEIFINVLGRASWLPLLSLSLPLSLSHCLPHSILYPISLLTLCIFSFRSFLLLSFWQSLSLPSHPFCVSRKKKSGMDQVGFSLNFTFKLRWLMDKRLVARHGDSNLGVIFPDWTYPTGHQFAIRKI